MKKILYVVAGLLLSLCAALLTGCDKNNEPVNGGTSGGSDEVVRGSIEGVVKDAKADTVIGQALVELLPTDKQTQTDAKGAFSFTDLKKGTYRVRVSKDGYEAYTGDDLDVTNGVKLVLSVALVATAKPDGPDDPEPGPVGESYVETAFGMRLQMVAVAGGTFQMGATSEQGSDAYDDEKPAHSVTLDGFYIGQFEVTQAQWKAVMGTEPSYFTGDNLPVENVSWNDAVEFCEKLSAQTGKKYRLPTEAEWEYAARGGNKSDGTKYAGSNNIDEVAWYYNNSYNLGENHPDYGTHPVGTKKANGLGIYDMSGNVYEWCSDWYGSDYYSSSPSVNPQGPASGSSRVGRGGGWYDDVAGNCRVSYRAYDFLGLRSPNLGFRVVCER